MTWFHCSHANKYDSSGKNPIRSVICCFFFCSILSPLLVEYDSNIRVSQEQVSFLKVHDPSNNYYIIFSSFADVETHLINEEPE